MNPLSAVYGRVTRFRRHWYEQRPHRQRQLGIPVISVGNLVVGGSGKTPVVAALARLLHDGGYRPAVISRGYKRRKATKDVAVVSDGASVLADVDASGDEPQLLARRLTGVPIVVGANRYHAGSIARDRLGANVLILDDGFQHLPVARTVDLLLLSDADVTEQVLPAGRLREPLEAARRADALLVPAGTADPARLARRVGVEPAFAVSLDYQPLRLLTPFGAAVAQQPRRVVILAAIARPERFVNAVRELGYSVAQAITFRDHHWFTASEMDHVQQLARESGAEAILTTEKDAVRLAPGTGAVPVMFLPIDARIEPADAFRQWLFERIGPPQVRR